MSRLMCVCVVMVAMAGLLMALAEESSLPSPPQATGVVYHDVNGNQTFDHGDRPLPGVRVSNGSQIVATDGNGRYALPVDNDTILFVIKPRGWKTPLNEYNLPQFYYIHKPEGSPPSKYPGVEPTGPLPESVNFPLTPQHEPQEFKAIMFGDTQARDQKEVDWIAHDVIEELMGTDASFGVTLGDIAFNDLNVLEPLNKTIALLGIPWYNVVGNHDINQDAETRRYANETFERIYGPSYYSFDYGPVHFLVLDNIEWTFNSETGKGDYRGGIGKEQLDFIRTDLAQIPEDQLVVLMMHIPLTDTHDRHGLYRLIEKRPFCMSISAHRHFHSHVWITHEDGWEGPEPHHHIINVTVCGSWWSGAPDERGIPHTTMADGAPNGYSIMTFDGTNYTLDYYAAGRSPDYQMEIDAPEVVKQSETGETTVFVNVFNGSEKTKVELRVGDGDWQPMENTFAVDPKFQRVVDREAEILKLEGKWRKLPNPKKTTHLWRVNLPPEIPVGTHRIEIRATHYDGREHQGQRIIRVES